MEGDIEGETLPANLSSTSSTYHIGGVVGDSDGLIETLGETLELIEGDIEGELEGDTLGEILTDGD